MASTARHRANPSPRLWAVRGLVAATTVPVGALAGCVVAAVAAGSQNPGLGVTGLALAGVPLTLQGLRARRSPRGEGRGRGRHLAGAEGLWPAATPVLEQVPLRLDPAVDPAAPSPAAAAALSLVPVAVAVAVPAPRTAAVPAPRTADDAAADAAAGAVVEAASPAVAQVVVRVGREPGDVSVHLAPGTTVAPEQRAAEIAQLNRLWATGTGPDTGSLRVSAAA